MPEIFTTNTNPNPEPSAISPKTLETSSISSPLKLSFAEQDPDEQVLLILRKHFITNVSWILNGMFFFILPPVIHIVFPDIQPNIWLIPSRFLPVFLAIYYISIMLYMLTKLATWLYDVFIITQKRIVDIDFSDVIYHDVAITKVEEVEDVHYNHGGFLSSIFNFGNLFIQTQGNKANFEAYNIPNPSHAAQIIISLTGKGGKDD